MVKKRRRVKGNQEERDWSERAGRLHRKTRKSQCPRGVIGTRSFRNVSHSSFFAVPFSQSYEIYGGGGYIAQRSRMDEIEGAGLGKKSNYKRQKILVLRGGKKVEARTYVGTAPGRKRFLRRPQEDRRVREDYFNHLLAGARQFHFSERYILYLRKQAFR